MLLCLIFNSGHFEIFWKFVDDLHHVHSHLHITCEFCYDLHTLTCEFCCVFITFTCGLCMHVCQGLYKTIVFHMRAPGHLNFASVRFQLVAIISNASHLFSFASISSHTMFHAFFNFSLTSKNHNKLNNAQKNMRIFAVHSIFSLVFLIFFS